MSETTPTPSALVEGLGRMQHWLLAAQRNGHVVTTQETIVLLDADIARRMALGMVDHRMFLGFQDEESGWVAPIQWSHVSCMKSQSATFLVAKEIQTHGHVIPSFAIGFKTDNPERLAVLQRVRSIDLRLVSVSAAGEVSGVAKDVMHAVPVILVDEGDAGGGIRNVLHPPPRMIRKVAVG